MGEFLHNAFAQRIINTVRVVWIAVIVFLFPILARGGACFEKSKGALESAGKSAADHFRDECPKNKFQVTKEDGTKEDKDEKPECDKFSKAVSEYVGQAVKFEESSCAAVDDLAAKFAALKSGSAAASFEQCKALNNQAAAITKNQGIAQGAVIEALGSDQAGKFQHPKNKADKERFINQLVGVTKMKLGTV